MKFTRRTYKKARQRAVDRLLLVNLGVDTTMTFEQAYSRAKAIVARGRREKRLWPV